MKSLTKANSIFLIFSNPVAIRRNAAAWTGQRPELDGVVGLKGNAIMTWQHQLAVGWSAVRLSSRVPPQTG